METRLNAGLAEYLIALGDDELILSHRDSEWCGHAPILEEDIAFANLAVDELGHARLWYELAAELLDEDKERFPDHLAYFRDASEWRNVQLVSLPNGDWAFSVLRRYLFDVLEVERLRGLKQSSYKPLAEAAAKIYNEELYHVRHGRAWLPRLGLGTEESHRRMQTALNDLWPFTPQLFQALPGESELSGVVPTTPGLEAEWRTKVVADLASANLNPPEKSNPMNRPRTQQTEHMMDLLSESQMVARANVEARW
ncbi:MAG: phenylacetate-CoA oxygenase subunit PaaI [Anaerolineae bacterium]|nr:MAG: phenylacetate-CoA oxygenase subunit PaaI [Anaerolineae bacterium]